MGAENGVLVKKKSGNFFIALRNSVLFKLIPSFFMTVVAFHYKSNLSPPIELVVLMSFG